MPPPRRKLVNDLKQNEDEYTKRIRLEQYQNESKPTGRRTARTDSRTINHSVNSAFQPFGLTQSSNNYMTATYQAAPEMHFFKSNENYNEFSAKRCRAFFKSYASDPTSEVIGPEGIEQLCADLQVKPEDIVMLVLSWKLRAQDMGSYTLAEWNHGMTELKCDSITKLRNKVSQLRGYLNDPALFKAIFRYSFDFAKDLDQRCLDIEVAKQMLSILLSSRWGSLTPFIDFLSQSNYKMINKDQYYNILDFSRLVDDDFKNYDANSAWPVMLDEFVDWQRSKTNVQVSSMSEFTDYDENY